MGETHRAMVECDLVARSGEDTSFALWEGNFRGCGEHGLRQERLGSREPGASAFREHESPVNPHTA